jgi:hypothetical protein
VIDNLIESQRHLKDAVLKGLEAFNIDPKEEGIEKEVNHMIYIKSENYNKMFNL